MKYETYSNSYEECKLFLKDIRTVFYKYYDKDTMRDPHDKVSSSAFLFDEVPSHVCDYKASNYCYWTYHYESYTMQDQRECEAVHDVLNYVKDLSEDEKDSSYDYDLDILNKLYYMVLFDFIYGFNRYLLKTKFGFRTREKWEILHYMTEEIFLYTRYIEVYSFYSLLKFLLPKYHKNWITFKDKGDLLQLPPEVKDDLDYQHTIMELSGLLKVPKTPFEEITGSGDLSTLLSTPSTSIISAMINDLVEPYDNYVIYYLKRSLLISLTYDKPTVYNLDNKYLNLIKLLMNRYPIYAEKYLYNVVGNHEIVDSYNYVSDSINHSIPIYDLKGDEDSNEWRRI